jgi:ubiquinone/menaquinone biosynthesis C-methylase UbiE
MNRIRNNESQVNKHYGYSGLMHRIESGLISAGKDIDALTVDDLAAVDEFHTRGRESTREVAALGCLKPTDHILDVGCGLGGTARHLAHQYGCKVTGVDLTNEYIEVGQRLTEFVGLDDRVDLHQGSALELPFEDGRFDVVWTEHVQMNIADKVRFYSEIGRILKPGGQLLFHDIFLGNGDTPYYPVPWAEDESISILIPETEARSHIERSGLRIDQWNQKTKESIEFFEKVLANGPPPLGIHLLMGETARTKILNYQRSLIENRVTVTIGRALKYSPES